ncbi:MAG: zinc ribbon domain-containing protein [Lactimicrobium sp.]|uniref:zinc ribbon domain-containing protein n=1 Tax=Lactimicrobium sp. TaxID=2563780 RepID=UPI002F35940F
MNKLENTLMKWNFKKIAKWYVILALITGLTCIGIVGYIYRERLSFAWQYARLKEADNETDARTYAYKTANASSDVVDVLILDDTNKILYSAKNSSFSTGTLNLEKAGDEKKYLVSSQYPDAAFQYVKSDDFLLQSILNKDFGRIKHDYDEDAAFDNTLSNKTVYMLSRLHIHDTAMKIYVISIPTTVSGGILSLKISAALAMLFFCIYWVLIALWLYRDAAKHKLASLYWGLIGLCTNIIGLIVYLIYKHSLAICPACGAAQRTDHLYCTNCGKQLGTLCPHCGSQISSKDHFCPHCGKKVY